MVEHKNNQKGFTLVELIVVITILAILAAIMIPACMSYIDKAKSQKIILNANSFYKAAQATASEFYGLPVPINPTKNDGKMTNKEGYWIPVTNDRGELNTYGQKFPYIKNCYELVSGEELPAFYAVAVVDKSKPGMIKYVTYYDVANQTVAYWDYESRTWTLESGVPKPGASNWRYVLCATGKQSENFAVYY